MAGGAGGTRPKVYPWEHCELGKPPMRPIDAHAWHLGRLLCHDDLPTARQASASQAGWYTVGNWLMAAGGLQRVTFDLDTFDEQSLYCPAPHPREVLDELDGFVRDLARFSFVWLAFEGTMKQLRSRSQLQKAGGEAQTAVTMLRESETSGRHSPIHASCSAINLSRALARAGTRVFEKAAAELTIDPEPALSDALAASRHFRNGFAHGGLFFPDPYSKATAILDRSICVLTTRVTLLAMQRLIGDFFDERSATIEMFDEDFERVERSASQLVADAQLATGGR